MANGFKFDPAAGNPGVNIWSRGDIFPLVIVRKERYKDVWVGALFERAFAKDRLVRNLYAPVLDNVSYDVLNADDEMSGFASYDDALEAAKGWLENKAMGAWASRVWGMPPFNPAAFDAELADDLVEDELNRDLRADAVAAMGGV